MSEIQTNPPQEATVSQTNNFDAGNEWSESSNAAKRILEEKPNYKKRQLVAGGVGLAIVAGAAVGTTAVVNAASAPPTFSEKTTEYTVQPGDGLYTVVESIPGINTVDERDAIERIEVDPANIDVLKNGLQPGERIEVPVSINGAKPSDK